MLLVVLVVEEEFDEDASEEEKIALICSDEGTAYAGAAVSATRKAGAAFCFTGAAVFVSLSNDGGSGPILLLLLVLLFSEVLLVRMFCCEETEGGRGDMCSVCAEEKMPQSVSSVCMCVCSAMSAA